MKEIIERSNWRILIETKKAKELHPLSKPYNLAVIVSDKSVLISHGYGATKFQALLKACRALHKILN